MSAQLDHTCAVASQSYRKPTCQVRVHVRVRVFVVCDGVMV
jgi:hypothetical protein